LKLFWSVRRQGLTIKLLLIYLGMILLGVFLVAFTMRGAFRQGFQDNVQPHLEQYIQYIRDDIGEPPQRQRAVVLAKKIPVEIYFQNPRKEWSTDGVAFPDLDEIRFWRKSKFHGGPMKFGEWDDDEVTLITSDDYKLLFITQSHHEDWGAVMLLPLVIIIAVFVVLYYLTQRLFSPLHTIRNAVNEFGGGDLERRLDLKRNDELGDVASSFNQMADRIQKMLESKRHLLLAISHELRSPLTRAKIATAMLGDKKQRGEIEDELVEMESLVGELLETERLNAGHSVLNLEWFDLNDLLRATAKSLDESIRLDLPEGSTWLEADITRLRLVIKNLLENALKYTPQDHPVPELGLSRTNTSLVVTVRNHGPGIAESHLAHIGDPFYRADPARQRATGGYGLGLYLSRVIVEAHSGTLLLESKLGEGVCVTLSLPNRAKSLSGHDLLGV
jgi:signal transduction histidine kinase